MPRETNWPLTGQAVPSTAGTENTPTVTSPAWPAPPLSALHHVIAVERPIAFALRDGDPPLFLRNERQPLVPLEDKVAGLSARQDRSRRGRRGARGALLRDVDAGERARRARPEGPARLAGLRQEPGRGHQGRLKLLREAAAAGFDDREFLQEEPSLAGLRARPEFQEILRSLPVAPTTSP